MNTGEYSKAVETLGLRISGKLYNHSIGSYDKKPCRVREDSDTFVLKNHVPVIEDTQDRISISLEYIFCPVNENGNPTLVMGPKIEVSANGYKMTNSQLQRISTKVNNAVEEVAAMLDALDTTRDKQSVFSQWKIDTEKIPA